MGKFDGASTTAGGVLRGDIGTAITTSNIALGVGWGDSAATVTVSAGSNAQRGQINILTAGSNQAQATATVTITFPEPLPKPVFILHKYTTNDNSLTVHTALTHSFTTSGDTTTAVVFTHTVLPVTAKNYVIEWALGC